MRPEPTEYARFYSGYVSLVTETDIRKVLIEQSEEVGAFWSSIPEELASVVHEPYRWKVRQVLEHLVDGERIFGYRLLRILRGDATPLPGFDEHFYADASEEFPRKLEMITESFISLRRANILQIENLPEIALKRIGTASGSLISVGALAFILAGHVRHHDAVLRKRLA
jgi:hypothetical protein